LPEERHCVSDSVGALLETNRLERGYGFGRKHACWVRKELMKTSVQYLRLAPVRRQKVLLNKTYACEISQESGRTEVYAHAFPDGFDH